MSKEKEYWYNIYKNPETSYGIINLKSFSSYDDAYRFREKSIVFSDDGKEYEYLATIKMNKEVE